MAVKETDLVKIWNGEKINKDSIDFLRTSTKEVQFPLSNHVKQIIEDLIDTYKAVPCAGIAANQIGYDKKLFIGMKHDNEKSVSDDPSQNIDDVVPRSDNYEIYINPRIDKTDKDSTQNGEEGCLSIPDISLELERFDKIKVRYYNSDGKAVKKPLSGFISTSHTLTTSDTVVISGVTTDISIPGSFMVLVPNIDYIGISRKITDKYEKRRLRRIIKEFKPKGFGIIIRTISQGKNTSLLKSDFDRLWEQWNNLTNKINKKPAPSLAYDDFATSDQVIRD